MSTSSLFAINNNGRVFALKTGQSVWKELQYLGVDFKKVSAHDSVIWALGGDHQVYVYVYGTSIPIRVCEESYENQRWNPIGGYGNKLLPTDRMSFTSANGLVCRHLEDIKLPTLAWTWEGRWHLMGTFEGKALNQECWTYAVDFPRTYTAESKWNSCVRRRKWIRYRQYVALDTWSAVPAICADYTEEPFIDIAVGGGEVMGQDADQLMIWGVTAHSKLFAREGICSICPEGEKWTQIDVPVDKEITSLSIGRTGRVWAVNWQGGVLVRTGVSRDTPLGSGWLNVDPPKDASLHALSVGVSSAWAISRDFRLWFRRGLDFQGGYTDRDLIGRDWLPMVGLFNIVCVGPNDQVWGIMNETHSLVFRTSVTKTDLTGKNWKPIDLPLRRFDPDNPESENDSYAETTSESSSQDGKVSASYQEVNVLRTDLSGTISQANEGRGILENRQQTSPALEYSQVLENMPRLGKPALENKSNVGEPVLENSQVLENKPKLGEPMLENVPDLDSVSNEFEENRLSNDEDKATYSTEESDIIIREPTEVYNSANSSVVSDTIADFIDPACLAESISAAAEVAALMTPRAQDRPQEHVWLVSEKLQELGVKPSSRASSVTSEVVFPETRLGALRQEELSFNNLLPDENLWSSVSGSGCWVNSSYLPKWFSADAFFETNQSSWRESIIDAFKERKSKEYLPFAHYKRANNSTSWALSVQCRFFVKGVWLPAIVDLEQLSATDEDFYDANVKISYKSPKTQEEKISCAQILLLLLTIDLPAKCILSIYTPVRPINPLTLKFSSEKEADEWIEHISSACLSTRALNDKGHSAETMWAVTSLGDVFVHDFCPSELEARAESASSHYILDVKSGTTPYSYNLDRGFRPGAFISITLRINRTSTGFYINLLTSRPSTESIALHFNPRFTDDILVLNTKTGHQWGAEKRLHNIKLQVDKMHDIQILCDENSMKISLDEESHIEYDHRIPPEEIRKVEIVGDVSMQNIEYNCGACDKITTDYYWRKVGGHFCMVDVGAFGVVWGISYDSRVYVYNNSSKTTQNMADIRHFYVWENQRWNPLTGFTYKGFPTDRHTWSDETGRYQRTKESTKLPSSRWKWISDWTVDYQTTNGVDKDGWQHATDFSMTYHGHRYVTDLVRRRRWLRKCRISTSGPWTQMEKVALSSLSVSPNVCEDKTIAVWGVCVSKEVVYREGVTEWNPGGTRWVLISSETAMSEISVGLTGVWAVCTNGQAHFRMGVTQMNPKGTHWTNIDAPSVPLKQVVVGGGQVWAVGTDGGLYQRANVQALFPEGTSWRRECGDVRRASVTTGGILWVVFNQFNCDSTNVNGVLAKKVGPFWHLCVGTGWSHVSVKSC